MKMKEARATMGKALNGTDEALINLMLLSEVMKVEHPELNAILEQAATGLLLVQDLLYQFSLVSWFVSREKMDELRGR